METQDLRYREVDVGESPETRAKIEKNQIGTVRKLTQFRYNPTS